jgi:hypothetical protein
MSTLKDRLYSCRNCGAEYIAYPPDDVHSESDANEVSDSIAIPYHCINVIREINYFGLGQ